MRKFFIQRKISLKNQVRFSEIKIYRNLQIIYQQFQQTKVTSFRLSIQPIRSKLSIDDAFFSSIYNLGFPRQVKQQFVESFRMKSNTE